MLRPSDILTTAALALCCSLMLAAAAAADVVAPPPSSIAASQAKAYEELRSQGPYVLNRDYGSPDAADAARDLPAAPAVTHAGPGVDTDSERQLVESPEVQQMVDRISAEISATPQVVEIGSPSGGFDWGDAGIGAAGAAP